LQEKFASSRNKVEAGIGKKIKNDIVPVLEELQKVCNSQRIQDECKNSNQ